MPGTFRTSSGARSLVQCERLRGGEFILARFETHDLHRHVRGSTSTRDGSAGATIAYAFVWSHHRIVPVGECASLLHSPTSRSSIEAERNNVPPRAPKTCISGCLMGCLLTVNFDSSFTPDGGHQWRGSPASKGFVRALQTARLALHEMMLRHVRRARILQAGACVYTMSQSGHATLLSFHRSRRISTRVSRSSDQPAIVRLESPDVFAMARPIFLLESWWSGIARFAHEHAHTTGAQSTVS